MIMSELGKRWYEAIKRSEEKSKRYNDVNWKNQLEVYCVEKDEFYKSLSEAERKTGCSRRCIAKVCKGEMKKTQNLTFTFVE